MRAEWEKEKYDKAEEDSESSEATADTADTASDMPGEAGATGGGKEGSDLEKELLSKGGKFPTLSKPFG